MTTARNLVKNTRWGCTNHKTSTPQSDPKLIKPTYESLFYILHTVILTYIEIQVSGLKHRDKFKAVVLRINFMYTPLSPTLIKSYLHPTTISGSTVGIMRDYTNEPIGTSPRVLAISTKGTYLQVSPS